MASKQAQEFVSKKISKLADEGYTDPKQRVAIAMSYARKAGYKGLKEKRKGKPMGG
jgi:hypothetical protein